jgi:BirA family biotin operon repressor/biotin-[acetyl-CoA-carboxylase] ligase
MMQEKILELLKKRPDYISGEDISHQLKMSRQALWKHIQELRVRGYAIVAVPHLGYKILSSPDRLFAGEITSRLNTKFVGKKIHYFDSLTSTMDIAMALGLQGEPEGALVLAEAQTKGRGRLGRAWISPKYKGIYLSLILRPKILPNESPLLTLIAAVSVCEAIKEVAGLEAKIKWPNDILLHHKKLGGILTELSAEMDATRFVVIGIGINVNNDKKALVDSATSLREQRKENTSRVELLQEILRRIEHNYMAFQEKGSRQIIEKWREYNITLGRRVRVACQKEHIEGEAIDIDTDGGLLLRRDSGFVEKVFAGDVSHCR